MPKAFREASVSPIPKKGDCSFQKNVRGICKESVIGKTLEKIVQKSMYEALEADDYFPESQFGFRKGRGCQQNLEIFHNFIHDALDNGFKVVVCFADLSRAFDQGQARHMFSRFPNIHTNFFYEIFFFCCCFSTKWKFSIVIRNADIP